MALELSEVVGTMGGGVILDQDLEITSGNEWVDVVEFEITTTSHVAVTIAHAPTSTNRWSLPAPTVAVLPADGRIAWVGVNFARADGTTQEDPAMPLNTAGQLEPGKYKIVTHSQKYGRNMKLTHVTVTAVPA